MRWRRFCARWAMQHEMNLRDSPFEQIKSGRKEIEVRLNDPKRQTMLPGHTIVFSRGDAREDTVTTVIVERYHYPSLLELMRAIPPVLMGYAPETTPEDAAASMRHYYSGEDELRYGALGLKLRVINQ